MTDERVGPSRLDSHKWLKWGMVLAAGVILIWTWGYGPLQKVQEQAPAPTSQKALEREGNRAPPERQREAHLPAPAPALQPHTPGAAEALPALVLGSSDYIRKKVLEANKDLADYKFFEQKVLRTQAETQVFQSMLTSAERLSRAFQSLASPGETEFSKEAELARMYQVDYLEQALRWKENPTQEKVLEVAERIILADNLSPGLPIELRRSLAGDKLELFKVLQEIAPDRAQSIVERARGQRVEKILALAGPGGPPQHSELTQAHEKDTP